MAKKIIAIVEDDEQQRSQYSQALRAQGYHVDEYSNRAQAEKMFRVQLPDLAILDIMLNHDLEGGFEICRFIEQIKPREVPILFLTSRGNEVDEIYGLNLGAWDYQTKPVTFEYLLARVRSLFNIKQGLSSEVVAISSPCQQLGPLAINSMTCKVTWHEQGVLLTIIPVGQRPRGIVLSHDQSQLYVATSDDHVIQVIDVKTLSPVGILPSGDDPETFALHAKDEVLFVSNEDDSLVSVVDVNKKQVIHSVGVGVEPEGIAVSPDGQWVVSASETTNMIHWIDAASYEVIDNTLVDPRPRGVSFTADSQYLWVTSELAGTVTILDVNSRQIIKTITLAVPGLNADRNQPVGVLVDPEMRWAYVAMGPANRVAVINAKTYAIEDYLLVGERVWNLAFSPDHQRLYSTNGVSNDVSIIDLTRHKVTKSIKVGHFPWGLAVKP